MNVISNLRCSLFGIINNLEILDIIFTQDFVFHRNILMAIIIIIILVKKCLGRREATLIQNQGIPRPAAIFLILYLYN